MSNDIRMLSVDEVRQEIDASRPDDLQLVDVRGEWEYGELHLPGARLIPLPGLLDHMDELDKSKPVITYCRSGARSKAAASLLAGAGFSEPGTMVGGVMAWTGEVAIGPLDSGFGIFSPDDTLADILLKGCAMEHHLQVYYSTRADVAETPERIELFVQLSDFEEGHKETLHTRYKRLADADITLGDFVRKALGEADRDVGKAVEGGMDINRFLADHVEAFEGDAGIIELGMMVEAQAMDFYLRCARAAEDKETGALFKSLASEERAHLKLLSRFMVPDGEEPAA